MMVMLDPVTYELIRYTRFFTFEKEVVEYSLGFVYDEEKDHLLFGYSVMDNVSKYVCLEKSVFDF